MYDAIKSLGQNFLNDPSVAVEMVNALDINEGDTVVEIGPGLGIVTELLSQVMHKNPYVLYAVEIDARFIPKLETMFAQYQHLHVVHDDVLKFLPTFEATTVTKVIGSLPFYITSPIVHSIIKMRTLPDCAVLMVQKEVAQKICALPPDGSYMSAFVQSFYDAKIVLNVPRGKFDPSPDVDAAVIKLTKRTGTISLEKIEKYEGFLHKAFKNPRKMLNKAFSKEELLQADIDPTLRPEAVAYDKWQEFFNQYAN